MKLPIKICTRCVMDSTDKKISFNKMIYVIIVKILIVELKIK